jgi:hypothetical protein
MVMLLKLVNTQRPELLDLCLRKHPSQRNRKPGKAEMFLHLQKSLSSFAEEL